MSDTKDLPIYFNDLNDEAKERFLKFNNCKFPEDGNWDKNDVPITVFTIDEPAIQIYSISDMSAIDQDEAINLLPYLGDLDLFCIDLHHPKYQICICDEEIDNADFKVFTLSPYVIQWAVDHCAKVIDYKTNQVWSEYDYITFYNSLKELPIKLTLLTCPERSEEDE